MEHQSYAVCTDLCEVTLEELIHGLGGAIRAHEAEVAAGAPRRPARRRVEHVLNSRVLHKRHISGFLHQTPVCTDSSMH